MFTSRQAGLFVLFILLTLSVTAQHQCAVNKEKFFTSSQGKKTRASNKDNALMEKYNVHHYGLDINCENNTVYISGNVTINAKTTAPLDTFAFELHSNHTIDSIKYNGNTVPFVNNVHMRYAILPTISSGTNISVQIFYRGTCPSGNNGAIGNGYSTKSSTSWGNKASWSLSQPYVAFEWWPCKQFLMDKVDSATIHVTTADTNKVGSNGLLQGVDTLANNKLKFKWHTREIMNYYLISVAISGYVDYSFYAHPANMDSILIQNYIYNNPQTLPYFKDIIDTTALQLEKFSEKITPYPFAKEKYGHCMTPFTGGMEHQTMTSLGFFNFDLVSHELMHQWFGDHVTCSTWKDIWVNEGFASYGEYLAREWLRSTASANAHMRDVHKNVKSQAGGSIYFTDTTNGNLIFSSRLTYDKGGAIVHTLRFILGDSLFFKTLQTFQNTYAYSNATAEQFKQVAEQVSGQNLTDWMNQWFYGEGYPLYSAVYNSNGSHCIINLKHTTSTGITTLFTTPVQIRLVSPTNGDTTITVQVASNDETIIIPTNKNITNIIIDPNNWVIDTTKSIAKNPDLYATAITNFVKEKLQVSISPNPISDQLLIRSNNTIKSVIVVDVLGNVVYKKTTQSKYISCEANAWANGIYQAIVIDENDQSQTIKFSKK